MKLELDTLGTISFTYIMITWVYMKIKYENWTRAEVLALVAIALLITAIQILKGVR